MTRRGVVVLILSAIGVVVVVAASIVGFASYRSATSTLSGPSQPRPISADQQAAYRNEVKTWPLALPKGQAMPRALPATGADPSEPKIFVSMFFRCAWESEYLGASATPDDKQLALSNLTLWVRLPVALTGVGQNDNVYLDDVIEPALDGQPAAIQRMNSSGDCDAYRATVTKPGRGLVIDKPQATALTPDQITNTCQAIPAPTPCDPAFGPNLTADNGSRDGARGEAILDGAGYVRAYVVARGDDESAIADRFGEVNLWALNCARRANLTLYAGDTLNLDKYSVATVGDENGSTAPFNEITKSSCLTQTAIPAEQWTP